MTFPKIPKPNNDESRKFIVAVIAGFVGMIMALSWNNILVSFLDLVSKKIPILGVLSGLVTATVITFCAVFFGIWFLNHLNSKDE